jgi:predicted Ser/Thr protein kinase
MPIRAKTADADVEKIDGPPLDEISAALNLPNLQVLGELGRGGMGVVYRARQKSLDRMVALKILPPSPDRDILFEERFMREARALARLSHPNIVIVHDYGRANDYCYFVMEYIDGVNLRHALRERTLSVEQALDIVRPVCDALQYAHDEGIVHRDIKPENILIDRKGRVKIADFGLARLRRGDTPHDWTITGSGQVMGTLHYMAPEQIERPLEVDHRADIYALGVVFYEMLTGELPIGRFPPPSQKSRIDVRLDDVVLRALEKEPGRRFQHASEIKQAVERISSSHKLPPPQPVAVPPPRSAVPAPPSPPLNEPSPAVIKVVNRIRTGCYALTIAGAMLFSAGIASGDVALYLAPAIGSITGGLGALFVNWRCWRQYGRSGSNLRQRPYTAIDSVIRFYLSAGIVLLVIGILLLFATPIPFVVAAVMTAQAGLFMWIRSRFRSMAQAD